MPYADPKARSQWLTEHRRARRQAWFSGRRCVQCGGTDRLELDHIDPAQKVSHRIWFWSAERFEREVAKCQVLCHDCHQRKSNAERASTAEHGTRARYSVGCRCRHCRDASAAYERARRSAKRGA